MQMYERSIWCNVQKGQKKKNKKKKTLNMQMDNKHVRLSNEHFSESYLYMYKRIDNVTVIKIVYAHKGL